MKMTERITCFIMKNPVFCGQRQITEDHAVLEQGAWTHVRGPHESSHKGFENPSLLGEVNATCNLAQVRAMDRLGAAFKQVHNQ